MREDSEESESEHKSSNTSVLSKLDFLYKPPKGDNNSLISDHSQKQQETQVNSKEAQKISESNSTTKEAKTRKTDLGKEGQNRPKIEREDKENKPIIVKLEENEENREQEFTMKLRKKICRKIFDILHVEIGVDTKKAQEATIEFEEKVYTAFPVPKDFVSAVKTIFKRMRVK